MKIKYHVGLKDAGVRELFKSAAEPTRESHGNIYLATIGPFRTKRGAVFMRDHGAGNPHCSCVNDAERIAAGFMYDIVLCRWVKRETVRT